MEKIYLVLAVMTFLISAEVCKAVDIESASSKQMCECHAVPYTINNFGDIYPLWQRLPLEVLTEKLLVFIEAFKDKGSPIILEVPHENSPILEAIKKTNFTLHYADNLKTEWIVKNNSSIPNPYTAIGGAQVIILIDEQVLVIEEKTRRGVIGFPAGNAETGEFIRNTASRELKEEVGLIVHPEDLKLVAMINRIKANQKGATNYNHFFVTKSVGGSLEIDSTEVLQAFWVPLVNLQEAKEINKLKITPFVNLLAKHIYSGCASSYVLTLPDNRQYPVQKDSNDMMHVEFFHQNLDN